MALQGHGWGGEAEGVVIQSVEHQYTSTVYNGGLELYAVFWLER
jgi:hypothetical protein